MSLIEMWRDFSLPQLKLSDKLLNLRDVRNIIRHAEALINTLFKS
jgi:hypothetical protein